MKKLLVVLLVITLMFSFTACGESDQSSSEGYIVKLSYDILEKASTNKEAAAELNNGNYYSFMGIVVGIEKDHAIVQFVNEYSAPYLNAEKFCAYVYLDSTTLTNLSEWQTINVTGKVTDIVSTSTDDESEIVLSITDASVQTEFELEGELLGKDEFYSDADNSVWNMDIEGDVYPVLLNLSEEEIENLSECKTYIGREVILKTKIVKGWYTDAELVEVLS